MSPISKATPSSGVVYESKDDPDFYNRYTGSTYQKLTSGILGSWLQSSLDDLPMNGARNVTICDYGSADGSTSMPLIRSLIEAIKAKHGQAQQIHVFYEDQPKNNFTPVFSRPVGSGPGEEIPLMEYYSKVFIAACGISFYSQCLPSNSVSLGFSTLAIQWLSYKPCNLKNSINCHYGATTEEENMFADVAAEDWVTFLLHRSRELVPGGALAVSCFTRADNSQGLSKLSNLVSSILSSMVSAGIITQEEAENMTSPNYFRNKQELLAPFKEQESAVRQAGLTLVDHLTEAKEWPLFEKWLQRKEEDPVGAATEYGKLLAMGMKGPLYNSIAGALASRGEERHAIVNDLFDRMAKEIALDPQDYMTRRHMMHLLIKKL